LGGGVDGGVGAVGRGNFVGGLLVPFVLFSDGFSCIGAVVSGDLDLLFAFESISDIFNAKFWTT
jgi:hypothetical protein